ncbi:S1/P1 nuclease [Pirellulaceae bacterium SH501]
MKKLILLGIFLMVCWFPAPALAWSEAGHAIIMYYAYRVLPPAKKETVKRLLKAHPRFAEDFNPPQSMDNEVLKEVWKIGRIGYWPDVARRQPQYHRSTWHYQLGASLVIGDGTKLQVPETPGPLPANATLETQELYILQALELCKSVLKDRTRSDADRSIALCWIAHLVADAHQPCHAGSLYAEGVFQEKDGDRGANRILTKQRGNLHALWDGLLGEGFDAGDVQRRLYEIDNLPFSAGDMDGEDVLNATRWIEESRKIAVESVYTDEILDQVSLVRRGLATEVPKIDLSEAYLKKAGSVAQEQALRAGLRLLNAIHPCLEDE